MESRRQLAIIIGIIFLLSGCVSANKIISSDKPTKKKGAVLKNIESKKGLSYILSTYFNDTMPCNEVKEKRGVNIKGLWKDLAISKEEVSWKIEEGTREHTLFFDSDLDSDKIYLNYEVLGSGSATNINDEYNILILTKNQWEYQLLLFKKIEDDIFADINFVSSVTIKDTGGYAIDPEFYATKDNSLLFSITDVGGRGTDVFSDYWAFYALVDGRLKRVLFTLKSGGMHGWGMLFNRTYDAVLMPYFYTAPDLGFTYYITYDGSSLYYNSKLKDIAPSFDLFKLSKDVYFKWDTQKKEYVLDRSRSKLNEEEIDGIFYDGEKQFFQKYKWSIKWLRLFGNAQQKEWAGVFERGASGKTETIWNEAKGVYEEVSKKNNPDKEGTLSIADALDTLRYYELKIGEVEVDMSYFLGWQPDDKKAMAMAAKEDIAKLNEIKKSINHLNLPKEVKGIKDHYLSILYGLRLVYTSIENKSSEKINKEYQEMAELSNHIYEKEAKPVFDSYLEKLPENLNSTTEENKFSRSSRSSGGSLELFCCQNY